MVPAPISMSSGCWRRQPRVAQNSDSLKISCCSVTRSSNYSWSRPETQGRRVRDGESGTETAEGPEGTGQAFNTKARGHGTNGEDSSAADDTAHATPRTRG